MLGSFLYIALTPRPFFVASYVCARIGPHGAKHQGAFARGRFRLLPVCEVAGNIAVSLLPVVLLHEQLWCWHSLG